MATFPGLPGSVIDSVAPTNASTAVQPPAFTPDVPDAAKASGAGMAGKAGAQPRKPIDLGSNLPDASNKLATTSHSNKRDTRLERKDEDDADVRQSSDDAGVETAADSAAQGGLGDGPILLAQAETGAAATEAAGSGAAAGSAAGGAAGAEAAGAGAGAAAAGAAVAAGAGFPVAGVLIGAVAVAAAAGGGGGGAVAEAVTGFTLSGSIVLGKINDATGLVIEAFKADGTRLAGGTGTVNADGSFTIAVTENYSGPVLIRLKDTDPGTNYSDEGRGAAKDVGTDLRAVINVSGNGAVTVNVTPLTELAVREFMGDSGGDGGTSETTLGNVTTTQVTAANTAVKEAFGLTGDITTTTPVTVDDAAFATSTNTAAKTYGQALAAIAGAEAATGQGTGDVLNTLAQGISGTTLDQSAIDLLILGATTADGVAGNATGTATALTAVIGSNISNIDISADTGKATDFITQTAPQTITATLDNALTGTKLWGSVDGGTTWTDISEFVAGTALTWTGVTLSGTSSIKLAVTADTVTSFAGAKASVVGDISVQHYSVDTGSPGFTSAAAVQFPENASGAAYRATVTDDNGISVSYSLSGTDAALFNIDGNSGAVTFKAAPNYEAPTDNGGDNTYDITITATDGAGNSSQQAVAITVNNVNEAPTVTSGGSANFAENGTGTVYTATATDPDAGTTLAYSLSGTDASLFNIDSGTGAVTFKTAPNYEAPGDNGGNNVYDITVTATDNGSLSASKNVAITVTNVNEAPTITSGATASFAENAATTGTVYTVTATDQDAGATLTYAIGGTDAASFAINASTGAVTFVSSPNFETKSSYSITVTASDGTNTTAEHAVTVSVTNVNEAPTSGTIANQTAVVNQAYSFDAKTVGSFGDVDAGDSLTFGATGLPTGLTINATTGVISGTAAAEDLTNEVTVTATDAGGLTSSQTFNLAVVSAPTITAISANVAQAKTSDALTFTATISEAVTVVGTPTLTLDVGGQSMTATYSGGTGTNSLTFTATASAGDDTSVTVSAIALGEGGSITGNTSGQAFVTTATGQTVSSFVIDNSNPAFTSAAAVNFAENGTGTAYASATTDATAVAYTLSGTDAGLFNISSTTGAVTFKTAPNFEAPADNGGNNVYDITVTATDALGHQASQNVAITVTGVNEAPTSSPSTSTATLAVNQAVTDNQ